MYDFNTGDEIGEFAEPRCCEAQQTIDCSDTYSSLRSASSFSPSACNKGHHGPVRSLAFTPSYNNYASGSEDGTIRIWSWTGIEDAIANLRANGAKDANERAIEKK